MPRTIAIAVAAIVLIYLAVRCIDSFTQDCKRLIATDAQRTAQQADQ